MNTQISPNQTNVVKTGLELVYTRNAFNQVLDNAMAASTGSLSTGRALRKINMGKLALLQEQIKAALVIGKHDLERGTEIAIYNIDLHTDRVKTQLQAAYSKWLTEVGMDQKLDSIRAINTFSEKVEDLKVQLAQGKASPRMKELLQKTAELIVDDLFKMLFKEAAERILAEENDH